MNAQTIAFDKRVTPPVSTSSTRRARAFITRKPFLTTLMLIQNRMGQTQKTTQFWQAHKNGEDPTK